MKNSNLITTLLAMLALFAGCRKDEPWPLSALPPATQTGENTAGCLINGEPWVAGIFVLNPMANRTLTIYDDPTYKGTTRNNKMYVLLRHQDNNSSTGIIIDFEHLTNTRIFSHKDESISINLSFSEYYPRSKTYRRLDDSSYNIEITHLDHSKRIVSGKFEMTLINISDNSDTLRIRNGRFDSKYHPF